MRRCSHCKEIFPYHDLRYGNGNHKLVYCINCKAKKGWRYPEKRLFRSAKRPAEMKGLEFNLNLEDILIPPICPLLHIPIVIPLQSGRFPDSPSIDRIDNSKGYTKENTWIISARANTLKSNMSSRELALLAMRLYRKEQSLG